MAKPTVFLLPGLLCDGSMLTHQVEALSAEHDVRVPDFTTFDSIGGMAQSVLDAAPERFSVAGHSMGARVALEIWRRAPERIERIALLDTGVHPVKEGEPAQRQALIDLAFAEGMQALCDRWLPPMVHDDRLGDEALMAPLRAMVLAKSPEIYKRQVTALLGRPDAAAVLPTITVPALVGVGRQDRWSPPAQHQPMAAAIPGSTYVIFEDSGHMSPAEAPQAVSQALLAWLARPTT